MAGIRGAKSPLLRRRVALGTASGRPARPPAAAPADPRSAIQERDSAPPPPTCPPLLFAPLTEGRPGSTWSASTQPFLVSAWLAARTCAPRDLLAATDPVRLPFAMDLLALGIDPQRARRGGPPFLSRLVSLTGRSVRAHIPRRSILRKQVIVDGLVQPEFFGQQCPMAARLHHVEHRIDDRPPRRQRSDQLPLVITQIRCLPPSLGSLALPKIKPAI